MAGTRLNTIIAARIATNNTGNNGLTAATQSSATPTLVGHSGGIDYINHVGTGVVVVGSMQAGFEPPTVGNGPVPAGNGPGMRGAVVSITPEYNKTILVANNNTITGDASGTVLVNSLAPIMTYQWGTVNTGTNVFTPDTTVAQATPTLNSSTTMRAILIQCQNLSSTSANIDIVFSLLVQSFGDTASAG